VGFVVNLVVQGQVSMNALISSVNNYCTNCSLFVNHHVADVIK
jgi:hypothetical protein